MKKVKKLLKQLAKQTNKTKNKQFFKDYLNTIAKFHNYSYYNQLLILNQFPKATKVAGIKTWNKLERKVKKKQKAIKILAPYSKIIDEEETTYFYPVNVFDISQTTGKPLPDIDLEIKGKNSKELLKTLENFCKKKKIKLAYQKLSKNLYGYSKGNFIVINNNKPLNTKTSTLIHEIAHQLLHKKSNLSKQQKEIQAEATAHVVSKYFNMESKSFNYLALYDTDYKKIMENFKAISRCTKEILSFASANKQLIQLKTNQS